LKTDGSASVRVALYLREAGAVSPCKWSFSIEIYKDIDYTELTWGKHKNEQNIHYLHGALPFFDTGSSIVKEEYNGEYLLRNIENRIDNDEYPIFVTAGPGEDKLIQIKHNSYLSFCYDKLSTITGSLITYGFNFGEYDDHIINVSKSVIKYS